MSDKDVWTFIAIWVGIALVATAIAAVVNGIIAIVTAPWFPVLMATMGAIGASTVVVYVWSRLRG